MRENYKVKDMDRFLEGVAMNVTALKHHKGYTANTAEVYRESDSDEENLPPTQILSPAPGPSIAIVPPAPIANL